MVIYADSVFVLNTLVNWMLLRSAAALRGTCVKKRRLWMGAAVGGLYAVLALLPPLRWLGGFVGKPVFLAVMLAAAFGIRRQALGTGAVFVLLSVVLCGAIYTLLAILRKPILAGGFYPVTFPELLLTCALSAGSMVLVLRFAALRPGEKILSAELRFGGQTIPLSAFADTGNSLTDPLTGASVPVVEAAYLAGILGKRAVRAVEQGEHLAAMELLCLYHPRLIPFRTVGTSSGLLLAIRCDGITVNGKPCPSRCIALSPTPVSDRGDYHMLLGGKR